MNGNRIDKIVNILLIHFYLFGAKENETKLDSQLKSKL